MGHSMGAVTALALAGTYPDLPGTILLEDPPPFWAQSAPSAEQTDRRKAMAQWMIELKRKTPDEMMDESRKGNPTWPEAERGPWVESKVRMSFNVLSGFGQVGLDLRAAVQRIICPALLITADVALGGIASAENAADLQSLVPHLRIAHVAGAGHNIRREQPTQFLRVVSEFIG
jgi:pimeloyl-ACP methyl ester carboxylesterase